MIYELRIYSVNEGRMEDLLNRFRKYTLAFFEKYNINALAFFDNKEQNKLFYILQFENEEKRDMAWNSFLSDTDWKKISEITNKKGRMIQCIESHILYSIEMKKWML